MPAAFLRQKERDWISKKTTNVTAQTPVGELRRKYWSEYLGASSAGQGMDNLERAWLIKYITTNLGTVTSTQIRDLWKNIVTTTGKTPSNFSNDNKILFYTNAA